MKNGQRVFFWKEDPPYGLIPVPAVYLRESDSICAVCHEEPTNHDRFPRKHPYTPMDPPGSTIEVEYWDQEGYIHRNVQYGKQANCFTVSDKE